MGASASTPAPPERALSEADVALLHSYSTQHPILSEDDADVGRVVDLHALARAVRHRPSFAAARLSDAARAHTDRYVPLAEIRLAEACDQYTLPASLRHAVQQATFFNDIADVRTFSLASLVSKAYNSRCFARKYGTVAEKALLPNAEQRRRYAEADANNSATERRLIEDFLAMAERRRDFKRLVLAALLGNFQHCESRLESTETRRLLYGLLLDEREAPGRPEKGGNAFLQQLLHGAPMVVVWCVREFMVHVLLGDAGLRQQVARVMHFDRFQQLVSGAMTAVRRYLAQNMPHAWTQLGAAVRQRPPLLCSCQVGRRNKQARPGPPCLHLSAERHGQCWADLQQLQRPWHEQMLGITVPKPHDSECTFVLGLAMRSRAPLVPRPLTAAEQAAEAERAEGRDPHLDEDERHDDALHAMIARVTGNGEGDHLWRRYQAFREHLLVERRRDDLVAGGGDLACRARRFLSPAQFDALAWLVEQQQQQQTTTLSDIMRAVGRGGFGATPAGIATCIDVLRAHRNGTATKQQRLARLEALQQREPHAYNLLQIAAELHRDAHQARVVGLLPLEALDSQLRAANRKWLAVQPSQVADTGGFVERTAVCLHFCDVCERVYSSVRDASTHTFFGYGLVDAACDFLTGELYCADRRVTHRGVCATTPLTRVCLLGLRFQYARRVYQLCCGCSSIMSPPEADAASGSSSRCDDDAELGGLLCHDCTTKKRDAQWSAREATYLAAELERCCCLCPPTAQISGVNGTHLYPHGLCLCRRHHSRHLAAHVELQEGLDTREATRAAIIAYHVASRQRRRQALQPQADRAMRRQRQRDRMRRA